MQPPVKTLSEQATRDGYVESVWSIVINTLLFGVKLWVGLTTGALALVADAWHTLSDSFSSVAIIVALKFSSQRPDREHPFGHGRWEQIGALFVAFFLAAVAYEFLREAIDKLWRHESAVFGAAAIAAMALSTVIKEALAQYAFYLARKTGNLCLHADGWHHRSDALSSLVVLVGIWLAGDYWWLDGVLSGLIALMILFAAYQIASSTIVKLLGEKPDAALVAQVENMAREICPPNFQLHHFHLHNYVRQQELTFHLKLNRNLTIAASHALATRLEKNIADRFGITATAHVEPLEE
ncbi:MAG: cation diffusion facilitator family transporter [Planctomycetota bacterium]|jgi:cation diffusion facilitator family transporter|nr:cation diffusion facilitator family transporter [Planctomycetota bacterium]